LFHCSYIFKYLGYFFDTVFYASYNVQRFSEFLKKAGLEHKTPRETPEEDDIDEKTRHKYFVTKLLLL